MSAQLGDEVRAQADRIRELERDCARLLGEGRQVAEIAKETAGFGKSLAEACEAAIVAEREGAALEAMSGLRRPSRQPDVLALEALWNFTTDP